MVSRYDNRRACITLYNSKVQFQYTTGTKIQEVSGTQEGAEFTERCNAIFERVESFVNRSNLLKLWEKTETGEVSASGVYGPKNVAITRIPTPYAAMEYHHFSDPSALVSLLPYTMAHTRSFSVTENSQPVPWELEQRQKIDHL
jgi:hypothetical protein